MKLPHKDWPLQLEDQGHWKKRCAYSLVPRHVGVLMARGSPVLNTDPIPQDSSSCGQHKPQLSLSCSHRHMAGFVLRGAGGHQAAASRRSYRLSQACPEQSHTLQEQSLQPLLFLFSCQNPGSRSVSS